MELSEILGGAPAPDESASTVETPASPPEPQAPVEVTPEPTPTVEQSAQPRNEQGRFVKTEEKAPAMVPVSVLIEERRRRQEAEARAQKPAVKDEDFWQAPAQAARQVATEQAQELQQEIANIKYNLAEDLTRSLHADYDTVREAFIAKVHGGDPWALSVAQQMAAQPNPAKFVYDQTRRQQQLEQIGDLDGYTARIRAQARAEVLAELQKRPAPPEVPQSLNSEPSAHVPSEPSSFEPTPLGNLFDRPF